MVSSGVQYTNRIYILNGASIPFVLRETGGRYQNVGHAYVYGLMDGTLVDIAEKHAAEESETGTQAPSQPRTGYYQQIDII